MALTKCPECELQVSDKALSCPHCGYPLNTNAKPVRRRKSTKRMRLPNGMGNIMERRNQSLRKPFYVRVNTGRNPDGSFIYKPLKPECSFETYQEAYNALIEYHKNPYDLDSDLTLQQLYEQWTDAYFKTVKDSYIRTVRAAWAYCSSIYNMRAKDVKTRHIKGVMEEGYIIVDRGKEKGQKRFASPTTKTKIKSVFNLLFDYALEYEIVTVNPARAFEVSENVLADVQENKRGHIIFTDDEISKLWDNVETIKYVNLLLIQCYMGWRPQELAILNLADVNLDNWSIRGGIKTDAGKQRIVPIHSRIKDLIRKNYDFAVSLNSTRLFNDPEASKGGMTLTYGKYTYRFDKVINTLGLNAEHRAHDPRKTFITRAKKAGINDNAIKKIVGHSIADITEATYTDRDLEWLRKDIEKMQ